MLLFTDRFMRLLSPNITSSRVFKDTSAYEAITRDVTAYGSVSLAVALAQDTGIIRILCEAEGPLSSEDVAQQGKLKERYVRELLNALATARLVQLEPGTGGKDGQMARYVVPPAHRKALTAVGVAGAFQSYNARHFADIRDNFRLDTPGGGPAQPLKEDFFVVLDQYTDLCLDNFVAAILKTPGLRQNFENGIQAVEVGGGFGRVMCRLAAMFPKTHFTITDFVPEPLVQARKLAEDAGLTNVAFQLVDLYHVPDDWQEKYDWALAINVLHDLPSPAGALQAIFKILKPGGHFSVFDQFTSSYVSENVGSKPAMWAHGVGIFVCVPLYGPGSAALGPCWGEQKASQFATEAGFRVLGLTRSGTEPLMPPAALFMCHKPQMMCRLAAMFPKTHSTITDLIPEPLVRAKKVAEDAELTNVAFQVVDVCHVPDDWQEKYDWVLAINTVHDLPNPS